MTIQIPEPDDARVLRHVRFDGYRLLLWETTGRASTGQTLVGYAFFAPSEDEPIFVGEDFGCAPSHEIDSDDAIRSLLGFLTLRPGDTDAEYFDNYTERQHAFCANEAEALSIWACEQDDIGDNEPLVFEDLETCFSCGNCGVEFHTAPTPVRYNEGRPEGPNCPKCESEDS